MPETMTEPIVEAPTVQICATQKCKRPLTFLGPPQNCWRCLVCNPIVKTAPTAKKTNKYIDVKLTEGMVREIIKEEVGSGIDEEKIREIVQDEMANWHIQKPSVTQAEIAEAVGSVDTEPIVFKVKIPKPETWLQKAKRLGVQTHNEGTGGMRKKVDIMADMEAKEKNVLAEAKETKESPKGDVENPSATVEKGA